MGMFDVFSEIRRSMKSVQDRHKALREELGKLHAQRQQIMHAPIAKADVKALLTRHIQASAAAYMTAFAEGLKRLIRNPQVCSKDSPDVARSVQIVGAGGQYEDSPKAVSIDGVLCAALGPQLLAALTAALDSMDWAGEGLPLAERPAAMAALDARIEKLMAEEAELIEFAEEAGVRLS